MKRLISLFTLVLFLSFGAIAQSDCYVSEDQDFAMADENGFYGTPFDKTADVMDWKTVDKSIRKHDGAEGMIRGTVNEICQAKGCWLSVTSDGQDYFVKFKDYAFFLPRDITGMEVVLNGVAYYEITSVEELQHFAADAGKSEEEIAAITEPTKELKFMATGAVVLAAQ